MIFVVDDHFRIIRIERYMYMLHNVILLWFRAATENYLHLSCLPISIHMCIVVIPCMQIDLYYMYTGNSSSNGFLDSDSIEISIKYEVSIQCHDIIVSSVCMYLPVLRLNKCNKINSQMKTICFYKINCTSSCKYFPD